MNETADPAGPAARRVREERTATTTMRTGWWVVGGALAAGVVVTWSSAALARTVVDRPDPAASVVPVVLQSAPVADESTDPVETSSSTPTAAPVLPPVHVGEGPGGEGPGGPHHRNGKD